MRKWLSDPENRMDLLFGVVLVVSISMPSFLSGVIVGFLWRHP